MRPLLPPLLPIVLLAATGLGGIAHAAPAPEANAGGVPPVALAPAHPVRGALTLRRGAGMLLHLPTAAANVFVADPKVVQVHPAGPTTLFVFGVGAGQTTIAALAAGGGLIGTYGVTVKPSEYAATGVAAQIARMVPGAHVQVQAEPKGLMLTGWAETPAAAAQAVAIAQGFLESGQSVQDQITVRASTQVLLQVRIVQMTRSISNNLGINWSALGTLGSIGTVGLGFSGAGGALSAVTNGFVPPKMFSNASNYTLKGVNLNAAVNALASDNLVRILAEPNLTVISGQHGDFLVGGEVPVPVPGQNGQVTIDYKKFGVSLDFRPVVYSNNQISIKVHPKVSQPDYQNAVAVAAANQTIQVPSFSETSAETSVVLGSGQSFAIGGLLQDTINDDGSGVPGIGTIPILGALFHDDNFSRAQTELVIIVTPYIVRPVNSIHQLQTPDENYTPPTDVQRLLFMRQVGTPRHWQRVKVPGHAGFMVQ
jgi:pilus assembly protein CpaC